MRRSVIIGGGAAGAWMLLRMLQRGNNNIDIVEPRGELGRGLAYSASFDKHLLNVTTPKMDMLAEDGDPLFEPWLARRADFAYAPRRLYGEFLQEALLHEAELPALLELLVGLEAMLDEPFAADYARRLERARERVAGRAG